MLRRPTRTSFKSGQSGNPKGRPKGAKNIAPTIRSIIDGVLEGNIEDVKAAYLASLLNRKTVQNGLELAAKVKREIGPGSEELSRPITVINNNGWDAMKLRGGK
jgi:uncharacterized protein DUF5681